jgi:N-acetylneuraminate synthase
MPYTEGQLDSGNWKAGIVAESDVKTDAPVLLSHVKIAHDPDYQILKEVTHEIKAQLNEARIALNSEFEVEYSHHYGISQFREYGAVIINCINREYCKKILVQLPGQKHPMHCHPLKEETFQVLHGDLMINVDGHTRSLVPGDVCLVMPGVWHSFWTNGGCVVEEVSTTHFNSDSVYKDAKINKLQRHERKTVVDHWGRFQLPVRIEAAANE